MKLSKYDYEVLSQLDELLLSENESVRELLQQAMVMQALSRDNESMDRDKVIGPFQKMMIAARSAEDRLTALEMQMSNQDRNNATTGGYWADNTTGVGTYPLSGSTIWQTGLGPAMTHGNTSASSLDKDYLDKLSQWVKTAPKKTGKDDL